MSGGLWSVSRGLARRRDEYYERLDAADAPRQGDLDGRGNLSEKELRRWCEWFVAICEDQVSFMNRMFWLMSTILTARRQLSWPVETGNEFDSLCS